MNESKDEESRASIPRADVISTTSAINIVVRSLVKLTIVIVTVLSMLLDVLSNVVSLLGAYRDREQISEDFQNLKDDVARTLANLANIDFGQILVILYGFIQHTVLVVISDLYIALSLACSLYLAALAPFEMYASISGKRYPRQYSQERVLPVLRKYSFRLNNDGSIALTPGAIMFSIVFSGFSLWFAHFFEPVASMRASTGALPIEFLATLFIPILLLAIGILVPMYRLAPVEWQVVAGLLMRHSLWTEDIETSDMAFCDDSVAQHFRNLQKEFTKLIESENMVLRTRGVSHLGYDLPNDTLSVWFLSVRMYDKGFVNTLIWTRYDQQMRKWCIVDACLGNSLDGWNIVAPLDEARDPPPKYALLRIQEILVDSRCTAG